MKVTSFLRLTALIKNRLVKIKQSINAYTGILDAQTIQELYDYASEAKNKVVDFDKNLKRLLESDIDDDSFNEREISELQDEVQSLFISINAQIKVMLPLSPTTEESSHSLVGPLSKSQSHEKPLVRLPKIELKHFSGDPLTWVSFINLFDVTIHQNTELPEVAKFQYLLGTLSDEPLNLIKSLPITEANYAIAYNILKERYHSPRRLISLHLNNLLDLPNIQGHSVNSLRSFLNTLNEHSQALKALDCDVCKNNPLLVVILLRKLDNNTRKKFESSRTQNQDMPEVNDIVSFLNSECSHIEDAALHAITTPTSKYVSSKPQTFYNKPTYSKPQAHTSVTMFTADSNKKPLTQDTQLYSCFCCEKTDHKIYNCPLFKEKSPQERNKIVSSNHRCRSCLGFHNLQNCKSKGVCFKCSNKHHTLLHVDFSTNKKSQPERSKTSVTTTAQSSESFTGCSMTLNASPHEDEKTSYTVLLATTLVKLTSSDGTPHVFRALLDSCSQSDFISEHAAQLLNVKRNMSRHYIDGISESQAHTKGSTQVTIETLSGQKISLHHPVQILDKITSNLPRTQISSAVLQKVKPYLLADPSFHLPGPVDVLLGGVLFPKIMTGENHSLGPQMPHAVGTHFGFVMMGQAPCHSLNNFCESKRSTTLLSLSDHDLHLSLQRFWTIEEPPSCSKLSEEETLCNDHFEHTHSRDTTGRYIVRLPFKPDHELLGVSNVQAKQRFLALERKLQAEPQLGQLYEDFMQDYETSGHMKLCDPSLDLSEPHYFLPHHGVLKEKGSTKKLRTVFDASSKTSTQTSLNDVLMTGPKLQNNICDILLKFRCYNIVFSCDIRQMYRNIGLHIDDQIYQLIFWRDNPSQPLHIFKLTTVTYGLNSSPFLAIRTLHQLARDEGKSFPKAADILCKQTYVDDIIAGAETEAEALSLQQELIGLLKKGCFELRKWTSNSTKLLGSLPQEHCENPVFLDSSDQPHFSILGLHWSPQTDTFSYKIQLSAAAATKRQCLSWLAQIYDPCGFLSPATMWAKCFMQHIWSIGLGWDEPLPPDLIEHWKNFVNDLNCVTCIQIPRPFKISTSHSVSLCGFSDASELGYAAVVYLRCETNESTVITQVISKTKVAPLKKLSVPRLELCACYLLAQLIEYCLSVLTPHCPINQINAWTDSSVALTWIKTPPFKLKTFVANRVSQIQEKVASNLWAHISSDQNPADCASRGLLVSQLKDHKLWWSGPLWLKLPPSQWPSPKFELINLDESEETKKPSVTVLHSTTLYEEWDLLNKFSSWTKLQYVMTYILRFIHNCSHQDKRQGLLSSQELKEASLKIFKIVQQTSFASDITALKKKQDCSVKLQRLSPFLDSQGIIRVGGRLKHSNLSHDAKHAVVLPKSHHVVNLLIDHYHLKFLHSGPQLTQTLLFQSVWILSARSVIRSRVYKCLKCFRCKPRNTAPFMGDLPQDRITPSRCFLKTGIDFGGPFNVKSLSLRTIKHCKVYICIFVCFATKAVHIEIVSDLTTEAFIAALTRFVSRRGLCKDIFSDCGTNFVGAKNKLQSLVQSFWKSQEKQNSFNDFCTQHSITFHFNPPAAPHQGGLWESAIKGMKHHLQRVIGETILTYEEFHTLTTRVEAIMNSRPLTPMSSDPSDLAVLTPGHFLIGTSLLAVPEPELQEDSHYLRRWQRIQAFSQHVWRRWSTEYLHTLQQRTKWTLKRDNLRIGDLVIVHDVKNSSLSWPLGRIVEVATGKDGIVRVVKIKTSNGLMTRPAVKVFPLPTQPQII